MVPMIKIGDFVEAIDQIDMAPLSSPTYPQRWYLLRVHPNRESKVMRTFGQRGISGYVPMIARTMITVRRHVGLEFEHQRMVMMPLFPGLVIVPDFEAVLQRWRGVDGVIGLLPVGPCLATLSRARYEDVRTIVAVGNTPRSKRERMYETGQLVRIVDGPFRGFDGRIDRLDSRGRLSVLLSLFGRETQTELEEGQVAPVQHPTDAGTDRPQHRQLRRRP
jgi:transcriptional antiterminator NusG